MFKIQNTEGLRQQVKPLTPFVYVYLKKRLPPLHTFKTGHI